MSIELVRLFHRLILCFRLLLLPSILPIFRVFSSELALCIRWPNIGASASAVLVPGNIEGWFPLGMTGLIFLQVEGLSSLWHHDSKAPIFASSVLPSILALFTISKSLSTWGRISSVQLLSCVQLCDSHGLQHTRLPCPLSTPEACSNSWPLSGWCHPIISSSVVPFSSCLHSFLASGSFQMSQLFLSDGQSIGASASASVLPSEYSGLISLRIAWFDLFAVQEILKSLL